MNSFVTRVISALGAVGFLFALYYFFGNFGLTLSCFLAVVLGSLELGPLLFKNVHVRRSQTVFCLLVSLLFYVSLKHPEQAQLFTALVTLAFLIWGILSSRNIQQISNLGQNLSSGILGIFYLGTLPVFAARLIELPRGHLWYFGLLLMVFAGDIGAYFVGKSFGKTLLFPLISPKKTLEGALGGLLSTLLAAVIFAEFMHLHFSFYALVLPLSLAAQMGDFFESLMKRLSDRKDSGNLMPGHGGVLDRLDGVIFASPVLFYGAQILESQAKLW